MSLRDVAESDLPIFFDHQRDPQAMKMAAFPARDHEAFMAHWARILKDETGVRKTILYKGNVAGNILSFRQSGDTLIGYWIGRTYWGRGIATEALSEFLTCVSIRPLLAHVAKHNAASIRVLEKCGFKVCGEDIVPSTREKEVIEELILKLT